MDVADIESDSDDENERPSALASSRPAFFDESHWIVTNRLQWREALLYNYGAVSLPEGEGAEAEFDRFWNQSMRRSQRPPFRS